MIRNVALRRRAMALAGIVPAVMAALLLRWPLLSLPLERDEGAYATVATLWQQGAVPYRDAWDHKPPLLYLLYRLLPLGGAGSAWTLRLWGTVYFLLGVLLVYSIGKRAWDRETGGVAALLYAVAGSSFVLQGVVLNAEHVLVVPALAALWCLLRWSDMGRWQAGAAAGACLAAVGLIKPTAVPLLLPVFVLGLQRRQSPVVPALALIAGGAVVGLPFALYFLLAGAWHDALFALVTYNTRYLQVSQGQWSSGELANMMAPFAPLLLVAAGGAALALPGGDGVDGATRRRLAIVGWTLAFAIAALASLRAYVHYYYPVLPGLALLAAPVLVWLAREPHARNRLALVAHWSTLLALAAMLLVPLGWSTVAAAGQTAAEQSVRLYGDDGRLFADAAQVAAFVEAHSLPSSPLLVWAAEPEIYVLAQRRPATRYLYNYPLALFPELRTILQADLRRSPPAMVVVYAGVYPPDFDRLVTARGLARLTQIGHFEIFGRP